MSAAAKIVPNNLLGHVEGSINIAGYNHPVTYDVYGRIDKGFSGNREEPPEPEGVVVESVFIGNDEITNALDDYAIYQFQVCIEDGLS